MKQKDRDVLTKWFSQHGMGDKGLTFLKQRLGDERLLAQIALFQEGFKPRTKAIFFEGYPSHFICITIDDSKLHADLTVLIYVEDVVRLEVQVEGIASSIGLPLNENSQANLTNLLRRPLFTEPCIHEPFIFGEAPVLAKPADVRLYVKPFSPNPQYDENDDGSVDFHNLNLFQNVIENQHIADHIPPELGQPGRDIFGQIIPQGGDKKVAITCGPGVAFDEAQGQYYSIRPGYVTYENQRLSVESTYVVEKDVDMGVGNINFVSDVLVKGDVLSDFTVQAAGSIQINGTVSGAHLFSEKNIHIKLGLLGQGKSNVRAAGDFSTKFLNECKLEVKGNVEILTEAFNSQIGSLKNIQAKDAVVIGGQLVSIGKMHIGTLGSELGLRTDIFLGEDFGSLKRTEEVRSRILQLEDTVDGRLEGVQSELKFWQTDHIKEVINTERLEEIQKKIQEFKSLVNDLILAHQEYELLSQNTPRDREPLCIVQKKIYPGATFYCSGEVLRIRETLDGPVAIRGEASARPGHYRIVIDKKI
jgi:uncharacterized protein